MKNINWKLRAQNKATLTALIVLIISLIYKILGVFGVVPPVSENTAVEITAMIIDILALLGVVIDPTTKGVNDSVRAMGYNKPYDGEAENDE